MIRPFLLIIIQDWRKTNSLNLSIKKIKISNLREIHKKEIYILKTPIPPSKINIYLFEKNFKVVPRCQNDSDL